MSDINDFKSKWRVDVKLTAASRSPKMYSEKPGYSNYAIASGAATMAEIERQASFQLLHQALVDYQARFADLAMRGGGFGLLVLGWILTSREARAFIAASVVARWAAVLGSTLIDAASALLFVRLIHGMKHVQRELDALNYFPLSYYSFRVPSVRSSIALITLSLAPWAIASL
jgi:hypothetical protein